MAGHAISSSLYQSANVLRASRRFIHHRGHGGTQGIARADSEREHLHFFALISLLSPFFQVIRRYFFPAAAALTNFAAMAVFSESWRRSCAEAGAIRRCSRTLFLRMEIRPSLSLRIVVKVRLSVSNWRHCAQLSTSATR